MAFAGELAIGDVDAALLELVDDEARLLRRTTMSSSPWNRITGAVMPSIRLIGERVANTSFHFVGVVPEQAVQIAQLELVGVRQQQREVRDGSGAARCPVLRFAGRRRRRM